MYIRFICFTFLVIFGCYSTLTPLSVLNYLLRGSFVLDKYLNSDGELDYQKLWSEVGAIGGFGYQQRRELLYKEVVNAYNTKKRNQDIPARDRPEYIEVKDSPNKGFLFSGGRLPTEEQVVLEVNHQGNRSFVMSEDEYCIYDAFDSDYLVEVKVRKKWYPDCLVQYDKYDLNLKESEQDGKEFLYIVSVGGDIYVFNITKLNAEKYNFKWDWREMPKNTDFGGSDDKIVKFVGFIDVTKASVHYNYQT